MNKVNFDRNQLEKAKDRNLSQRLVQNLNLTKAEVDRRFEYYFSIPQPPQKSQEWLNQRTNYITASAFENAIKPLWSSHRNELLKNKVSYGKYSPFKGNEATRWGEKYEDVANGIYCYRQNVTVEEFGLIPHPDFPFLGASTDGISSKLINLEIKCPFSRKIKPGEVKPIYWKQMQLQMAVLDLELTHFLECTFQEYPSERDFWIDFDYDGYANQEKGIIIELVDHNVTNLIGEPKTTYQYSPIELCENEDQLRIWHKQAISKIISSKSQIYIRSHFWVLPVCSCVNVIRDREWFESQVSKFTAFWKDVEAYRTNGGFEKLEQDIDEHKPKRSVGEKIRIESPGRSSLKLDDSNELPHGYIMSSSDEDLSDHEGKKKSSCLIDSSDDEVTTTQKRGNGLTQKRGNCLIDSSDDDQDINQNNINSEDQENKSKTQLNLTPKKRNRLTRKALDQLDYQNNSSARSIFDSNSSGITKSNIKSANNIEISVSTYDGDDDSSESEDTPPLRPPSRQIFYRRRQKKSSRKSDGSWSSRKSTPKLAKDIQLEKHQISLKFDD